MIVNLTILILGLMASRYLFWRLPSLNVENTLQESGRGDASSADDPGLPAYLVSIIIPARNEADTLPLLLADLRQQSRQPMEIICVNDGSVDRTRDVIASAGTGVILVDVLEKPADWMGKAWACLKGAEQAKGQLLLFLDADVRLAPDGLARLLTTYQVENCTISVQPYHRIFRRYEQLSMFFNIVQIGANGTGLPKQGLKVGLYGPVILISKRDYEEIGGHTVARTTIADDLALGEALAHAGKKYRLFLGGDDISFRMYGGGVQSLFQGWTKNYATGAGKTPMLLMIPVFVWVTSCMAAPLYAIQALWTGDIAGSLTYLVCYGFWVAELHRIVPKVGNFSQPALLVYPIFILVFLATFFWSLWKKLFRRQVTWKGRKMKPEA